MAGGIKGDPEYASLLDLPYFKSIPETSLSLSLSEKSQEVLSPSNVISQQKCCDRNQVALVLPLVGLYTFCSACFEFINVLYFYEWYMCHEEDPVNLTVVTHCFDYGCDGTHHAQQIQLSAVSSTMFFLMGCCIARLPPAFVSSLLFGNQAHKFGLILPSLCSSIKCALYLVAHYFKRPTVLCIVGNLVDGMGGMHYLMLSTAVGYLRENIQDRKKFLSHVDILHFMISVIRCLASVLLGYWFTFASAAQGIWMIALLYATACIYSGLLLSPNRPLKTNSIWMQIQQTLSSFKLYEQQHEDPRARNQLHMLLTAFAFDCIVFLGRSEVDMLYVISPPFCFSTMVLGYFCALKFIIPSMLSALTLHCMKSNMHASTIAIVCAVFGIFAHVALGATVHKSIIFIGMCFLMCWHCLKLFCECSVFL